MNIFTFGTVAAMAFAFGFGETPAQAIDTQYEILQGHFKGANAQIRLADLPVVGTSNLTCLSVDRDKPMELRQANNVGRIEVQIPGQGPLTPARKLVAPVGLWLTVDLVRANPVPVNVTQSTTSVLGDAGDGTTIEFRKTQAGYLVFSGRVYVAHKDCEWTHWTNGEDTYECDTIVDRDLAAYGYCY